MSDAVRQAITPHTRWCEHETGMLARGTSQRSEAAFNYCKVIRKSLA